MFTEVKTLRTYEKIIEQIKEKIKEKTLRKGDKLPPERVMAEQMGVSRLAVREALNYLIAIGFVEAKPGSGNYISSDLSDLLYEPIYMYMLLEDVDFDEILTLRNVLQDQCAGVCAERITPEQLTELEEVCDKFEATRNVSELIELDIKFHQLITEGSNRKLLTIIYSSVSNLIEDYIRKAWSVNDPDDRDDTERLHRDILNAIKSRDKDKAIKAMQAHFVYVEQNIEPIIN